MNTQVEKDITLLQRPYPRLLWDNVKAAYKSKPMKYVHGAIGVLGLAAGAFAAVNAPEGVSVLKSFTANAAIVTVAAEAALAQTVASGAVVMNSWQRMRAHDRLRKLTNA